MFFLCIQGGSDEETSRKFEYLKWKCRAPLNRHALCQNQSTRIIILKKLIFIILFCYFFSFFS